MTERQTNLSLLFATIITISLSSKLANSISDSNSRVISGSKTQQQARSMMDFHNTPPLFVTDTRDFFVDVARQPLGTTIKTIRGLDMEGDQLKYSLKPANVHDASPYFTINQNTGELKLANRPFKFYTKDDSDEESEDETESDEFTTTENQRSISRNMYFLNVAADDGTYTSVVEIQIHVVNSSSFAATVLPKPKLDLPVAANSSYTITPDISLEKAEPSLEKPKPLTILPTSENQGELINSLLMTTKSPPAELLNDRQQFNEPSLSQPMLVGLVVACSCLIISLVLLMFIVPLSVRRLRKRLKHVELQHEQLSQKTSNGSSTVCSSSSTTSSTRNHMPSLSQFTLSSARSSETGGGLSVCRQFSLDSTKANLMSPPLFGSECRINNDSIANPLYLHQQQQHQGHQYSLNFTAEHHHQEAQIIQNQAFLLHRPGLPILGQQVVPQGCDNVYHPIDDDDFYSTINTGSTVLNSSTGVGEPNDNDNDHFLTNPEKQIFRQVTSKTIARASEIERDQQNDINHFLTSPVNQVFRKVTSKTIARASQIERDQPNNKHHWELDRHKLKFLDLLDAGQFGQVWRCNLKLEAGDKIVAVKTLKNSAVKDVHGREELLAEIEIMKLVCHHPNVVKILHCCSSNDSLFDVIDNSKPILLVMEYVELGKLQSYLESSRVNHNYATSQDYDTNNNMNICQTTSDRLTSKDLLKFIYHVAKGMEYISSQWIVHRDLASRNILVNSQRICKIGDFGMARHMQSFCGIYERHSRNTKIPVRWMAPEVLLNNRFTTKSDVFSFGILMWEIVTLGSTPYRHLKTEQVIDQVARNGERPTKPEYCHAQLYQIMSKCWLHEPDSRPTFGSLVRQLDELLLNANDYIELDQYPDHNYYNIPEAAAPNELL